MEVAKQDREGSLGGSIATHCERDLSYMMNMRCIAEETDKSGQAVSIQENMVSMVSLPVIDATNKDRNQHCSKQARHRLSSAYKDEHDFSFYRQERNQFCTATLFTRTLVATDTIPS
jgi:hypothetical protein